MKVSQLIKKLQALPQNDEVLLGDSDLDESGSQIEDITVRRVYDNDVKTGERRVAVIRMKEYGNDCYEFIND